MENFRETINLLRFVGAQLLSVNVDGKMKNCVVIPVDYNDIFVTMNDKNEPVGASTELRGWGTNEKFRQACIEQNADKEGYLPPSHQVQVSYGENFKKLAIAAAEKRLRADEKFMAKGLTDEEIKKEAEYSVNNKSRIGFAFPLKKKEAAEFTGQAQQAAAGAFVPPAPGQDGHVSPEDDLPF